MLCSELSLGAAETPLPREFRILRAGMNETEKGPLLFNDEAARDVMARFAEQGVDLMIDLNHDSLNQEARAMRNDALDAMGWARLEVRPGPELWAVDVRWADEGAARLQAKKQRYISPVALYNKDTRQVAEIFNLALVGMPATHGAAALVAASRLASVRQPARAETLAAVNDETRALASRVLAKHSKGNR